jgi:hypothetical protein
MGEIPAHFVSTVFWTKQATVWFASFLSVCARVTLAQPLLIDKAAAGCGLACLAQGFPKPHRLRVPPVPFLRMEALDGLDLA